jgi:hypothetical protein
MNIRTFPSRLHKRLVGIACDEAEMHELRLRVGSSAASGTWRTAKDCYTVPAFLIEDVLKTIVHRNDTLARK